MKQLVQKLRDGAMEVLEVPEPVLDQGMLLVRNHYSLISPGTESSTVSAARKSLIGKIQERPQQAKQVLDTLLRQGPVQTYRTVMKKLDAWSPLGYSCAGEVVEVAPGVTEFAAGVHVACAGAGYANHAEIVAVPVNLCVKLPEHADLKRAAYNTLGAIALQGVRQADLRLGESCAVIGLGLIGQLACLLLGASGIKVVGIDIDPFVVSTAKEHCAEEAFLRTDSGIVDQILAFTSGLGVDATIIAAGTESLDPINFAGEIVRKKGRIIIVGNVPTGFDRESYYRKELELRMSCSYGPGRYDPDYEEKGIDYPAAYVRWTEKRNMEAFQDLVHSGKINIDYLTTHVFKLEDAPKAYDMILNRSEPHLGILIEYDQTQKDTNSKIAITHHSELRTPNSVSIAFIGAGNYAQSNLLPNLPKNDSQVVRKGVMTQSGTTSKGVAEKFGFEFCTSNEADIFANADINTVFIATRHDSHGYYVKKGLEAGKHVFVEKPLCITLEELEEIEQSYSAFRNQHSALPLLMVGFNRRFSPLAMVLKKKVGSGPMSMIYRINAGPIPSDSWIQDSESGGGRIVGEVCHFVDFLTFVNGSLPDSVQAFALPDPHNLQDTLNVNISFKNGSIGNISYFANGSKSLFKEYIEIYKNGTTAVLRDFKKLEVYSGKRYFKKKLLLQDKGQKSMIDVFIQSLKSGQPSPIDFNEICSVSLSTFRIMEALRTKTVVKI